MYASEKLESADAESSKDAVDVGSRAEFADAGTAAWLGPGSRCVEVMLKIGSIWFRSTGIFEGFGGWSGKGESGDNVFVWNSGAFGVMNAVGSDHEEIQSNHQ